MGQASRQASHLPCAMRRMTHCWTKLVQLPASSSLLESVAGSAGPSLLENQRSLHYYFPHHPTYYSINIKKSFKKTFTEYAANNTGSMLLIIQRAASDPCVYLFHRHNPKICVRCVLLSKVMKSAMKKEDK